jgi:hypothetical protein
MSYVYRLTYGCYGVDVVRFFSSKKKVFDRATELRPKATITSWDGVSWEFEQRKKSTVYIDKFEVK